MSAFARFVSDLTPKFNKELVEGICYHKLNDAIRYIDNFIKYSVTSKTNTHLRYLGYQELSPKEELRFLNNKSGRVTHDIALNDMYLVKFMFSYGDEVEPREYLFYLPYMHKGNEMHLAGNKFLVMPTLADKVISVGERVIFINILTAKYNFQRFLYTVQVNNSFEHIPVINAVLYKNQTKKLPDTTKAKPTIIHYMLATHGYSEMMMKNFGFVPTPSYDEGGEGYVTIQSTGNFPGRSWVGSRESYQPTRIKFLVPEDKFNEEVKNFIGNIYYVIDHFPDKVRIDLLDDHRVWKRLMGEIIHSGNHGLGYIMEKMYAHFKDLSSPFDIVTKTKLKDVGVTVENLSELLEVIFRKYNEWMLEKGNNSLYYNKTYEVESFLLSPHTSAITRIVLDINKEELRIGDGKLDKVSVDKIFKKYFGTRLIFQLRREKRFVSSVEYPGDHLYFKNTAMVVQQESDFISTDGETNTSERSKLTASMATVGSILGLSKRNPTPLIRLNPYVRTDYLTGTVLPHPDLEEIVKETDLLLSNIGVDDYLEKKVLDTEAVDSDESDYSQYEYDSDDEEIISDNWD